VGPPSSRQTYSAVASGGSSGFVAGMAGTMGINTVTRAP
jgi:hypothetical protein